MLLFFFFPSYQVYFIVVYRPPSNLDGDNEDLVNFLKDFCSNKEVVIMGDFNLSSLKWNSSDLLSSSITPLDLEFYETFIDSGLQQVVKESTYYPAGSVLDLCLVTDSDRLGSCHVLPPLPSCGHCPVLISYVFQNRYLDFTHNYVQERLWTKGKYELMSRYLSDIDWVFELTDLSTEDMYHRFLEIINPCIERYVPLMDGNKKHTIPWKVNPPRQLERDKSEAWLVYKRVRCEKGRRHDDTLVAWNRFKECNNTN